MKKTEINVPGLKDYFTQESFNVLRTNLQFCGQDIHVVAITSCGMSDGKTYVSLHLAKSLAEIGKKVLLLDTDMRKSVMAARYSSLKKVKGVSEVITAQATLQECICETQYEGMHVLFAGQYPPNPSELLNTNQFRNLVSIARESYDYVIVDTPPLGMVIDAAIIAAYCDGAILVVGNHGTKDYEAQDVLDQLNKSGCKILGAVLNHVGRKTDKYYRNRQGKRYYAYKAPKSQK